MKARELSLAVVVFAAGLLPTLIVWGAWNAGVDYGVEIEQSMGPRIWGYDCARVDEPNANEVRCLKRFPTSYIATSRGGLLIEPSRTNEPLPKVVCDWTDREALTFIHWRDFDLHRAHEDEKGLVCESNNLWSTWLVGHGDVGPGAGFLVTKYGSAAYLGRVCRPIIPSDTTALKCDESKERGTSACRPRHNFFTFPEGVPTVRCLSTDPKGCP